MACDLVTESAGHVKVLMWELTHSRLLTNGARWRRGLALSDACSSCCDVIETYVHVVRVCSEAHEILSVLIHPTCSQKFFSLPLL